MYAVSPRDPGLQQERSRLAWRRTVLSVVAVAALIVKVLTMRLGTGSVVPAAVALAMVGWLVLAWMRRSRLGAVSAREPGFDSVLADGRPLALAAGIVVLLALCVLLVVLRAA